MRKSDVAHVELEVEVRILDPIGVVEIQGRADELLAEAARQVQAPLDVPQDPLEGDTPPRPEDWS